MTKAQMKENVSKLNRQITKAAAEDNSLAQLQELCAEHGDGKKWCSWDECLRKILMNSTDKIVINRAISIYTEHIYIQGKSDALTNFLIATNNFE